MTNWKCVKWTIAILNLLILIAAVIACIVMYVRIGKSGAEDYYKLIKKSPALYPFLAILAFCLVVCVVGFLIMCCENKCWAFTYLILLLVVLVVELVILILMFARTESVMDFARKEWNKGSSDEGIKNVTKNIELALQCCSFDKPSATESATCATYDYKEGTDKTKASTTGCYTALKDKVKKNMYSFGAAAVVIFIFEIILLVISIMYACCYFKQKVAADQDITGQTPQP